MLPAIFWTILATIFWIVATILIGYEMPYLALFIGLVAGWQCTHIKAAHKIVPAIILTLSGIVLAHFLNFSFYMQYPLDGVFSPLNLSLFFQINRYVPGFWSLWDGFYLLVATGLSILIVRWRSA